MPRSKKTKKIPVMFEKTISVEEIEKRSSNKKNSVFKSTLDNRQKQLWMWGGVAIVMVTILASWFYYLPQQLKIKNSTANLEKELFSNTINEFSTIIAEQQTKTSDLKKFLGQELKSLAVTSALASSTTSTTLTTQQIEELKNKIEKK
ncbi:MAG TPA: hypothetical protein PKY08_01515 [Candidatus Magasanikbacteria bacterium]|nr:hypothetical protein [Candidatus Magasanikbacteria bacterium]